MATQGQEGLISALVENTMVKAALIINDKGRVKLRKGRARVLKSITERLDKGEKVATPEDVTEPLESVYIVEMTHDFLAVVFEDDVDFEKMRRAVDTLIAHAGLERPEVS